jgi:hypothetical protein
MDTKVPMDITATLSEGLSKDKEEAKFQEWHRSLSNIVLDDIPCPLTNFPYCTAEMT